MNAIQNKMRRRAFLKSIATACGAAVVCPGELLKSPVEFRLNQTQKDIIVTNARQEGCTNSILYGIPYYFRGVPIYYRSPLYDETNQT